MARVSSRQGLIDYCKRQLGFPVVKINVDDDQISDRIDDAFQYYRDYHMDATEKTYLKYQISQDDIDNRYIDITRASGSVTVESGSDIVSGNGTLFTEDMKNASAVVRINNEIRQVISVSNTAHMQVNAAFSSSATNVPIYVPKTDDTIISITRLFNLGSGAQSMNMFDLRYQLRLNELYDFTSTSYVPYVITMQHLRSIEMLFIGEKEIRFNRHANRLYLDFNLHMLNVGEFIVAEAYRALDPDAFTEVYNDRWLKAYATALIKRQWGTNLKKYAEVALIGGVKINGQQIFDEAIGELTVLEEQMRTGFQLPPMFIVG